MSWLYLRALVADCSVADCSAGESCAPSKTTPTGKRSCSRANRTAASILSQSGTTCELLTDVRGVDSWMSSLRAFRVQSTAKRLEDAIRTKTYGPKLLELLGKFGPTGVYWRTFLGCCIADDDLETSYETWPRCGSMWRGTVGRHAPSAPHTVATDCGSWLATPTATANQTCPSMQKNPGCRGWTGEMTPARVEWAMGWPIGWTDLRPLEMDKFQQWLSRHGGNCPPDCEA